MEMIDRSVTFSVLRKTEEVLLKEPMIGTDSTFTAEWARPLSDRCSADRSHIRGLHCHGPTLKEELWGSTFKRQYCIYINSSISLFLERKKQTTTITKNRSACLSESKKHINI